MSRAVYAGLWAALLSCLGAAQAPHSNDSATLAKLLTQYTEMGLPLPPANTHLAIRRSGRSTKGGEMHDMFQIGFIDNSGAWVGTERLEDSSSWEPIDPSTASHRDLRTDARLNSRSINTGLATAIQCEARGLHELAATLFRRSLLPLRRRSTDPAKDPGLDTDVSPALELSQLAWAHWCIALDNPENGRGVIARRMEKLMHDEPELADDPNRAMLLESLKALDTPGTAPAGSVEATIDDLINVTGNSCQHDPDSEFWNNPRLAKVVVKGFDVVPLLIAHLEDSRLSNAEWRLMMFAGGGPPPDPIRLTVGDIAGYILAGMAGESTVGRVEVPWYARTIQVPWTDVRARASHDRRAAAQIWWSTAKAQGEEAYLVAHAFPKSARADQRRRPVVVMFQILAAKHPNRLPEVFEELTSDNARPDARNQRFNDAGNHLQRDFESAFYALVKSNLPLEQKIALLIRASNSTSPYVQRSDFRDAADLMLKQFKTQDVAHIRAKMPSPTTLP